MADEVVEVQLVPRLATVLMADSTGLVECLASSLGGSLNWLEKV
jgi:hypothetical protein